MMITNLLQWTNNYCHKDNVNFSWKDIFHKASSILKEAKIRTNGAKMPMLDSEFTAHGCSTVEKKWLAQVGKINVYKRP
jgi:hypothetical protein